MSALHRNNHSLPPLSPPPSSLLPPGLIRVRHDGLLPPPHGSGEVRPVVGDETPEEDGGAGLVVLLLHGVALVVHRGEGGHDDDEVDQESGGRMCVDLTEVAPAVSLLGRLYDEAPVVLAGLQADPQPAVQTEDQQVRRQQTHLGSSAS